MSNIRFSSDVILFIFFNLYYKCNIFFWEFQINQTLILPIKITKFVSDNNKILSHIHTFWTSTTTFYHFVPLFSTSPLYKNMKLTEIQ